MTPARLGIVSRTLEYLEALPNDDTRLGPDASIVVWAMAEFIAWSSAVPGMPTLLGTPAGERLRDGANLLQAIRGARIGQPVQCILRVENEAMPSDAIPFSAEAAGQFGTDRRAISFERALDSGEEALLQGLFTIPPSRISPRTYGWDPEGSADPALEDWPSWYERLERQHQELPAISAVNGRRPAWFRSARGSGS
jgi:hypothetical protein